MPRSRLRPPAWYPDVTRPDVLRYWDGRRWTNRCRPHPGWAPVRRDILPGGAVREPPAPVPVPRPASFGRPRTPEAGHGARLLPRSSGTRPARAFALASAAALVAGLVFFGAALAAGPRRRPVGDTAFLRAVNTLCEATLAPLRRQLRPRHPSPAQRADRVDSLARTLEGLAVELRTLPVREADRPVVDRWLATWDAYTVNGHQYATALRDGDPAADAIRAQGNDPDARLQTFARVNGIYQCVF